MTGKDIVNFIKNNHLEEYDFEGCMSFTVNTSNYGKKDVLKYDVTSSKVLHKNINSSSNNHFKTEWISFEDALSIRMNNNVI